LLLMFNNAEQGWLNPFQEGVGADGMMILGMN